MNINEIYELQRKNNESEIKYQQNKKRQELKLANINSGINVTMSQMGYVIISSMFNGIYLGKK